MHHLATQAGEWEAKDTGEEAEECILAQTQRIGGRRIARQVWRDIHQHSTARRRFAGPPPDPTHSGPSRETQQRRMDEDETIYQLERKRWQEDEQEEAMLPRRGNKRTARGIRSRRCCSRWRSADLLLAINPLRDLLLLCATSLLADLLLIGEGGESGEREHEEGGGPKQQEGEM